MGQSIRTSGRYGSDKYIGKIDNKMYLKHIIHHITDTVFVSNFFINASYYDNIHEIAKLLRDTIKNKDERSLKFWKNIRKIRHKFRRVYINNLIKIYKNYYYSRSYNYNDKYKLLGYTYDEYTYYITYLKNQNKVTKEKFIKKFGEEEGLRRWNEFRYRSAQTLENFIKRYGEEEGKKRYESYISRIGTNLDKFREKYGYDLGTIKYIEYVESTKSNLYNMISKHGPIKGYIRYLKVNDAKRATKKRLIAKYGREYAEKVSREKGKANNINYWINKYGEIEGTKKFYQHMKSKEPRRVSAESQKFINNLLKKIYEFGFVIAYKKECFIYSKELNSRAWLDLYFPDLKIAVEYHGSAFHYNPNNLITTPISPPLEERKIKDERKRMLCRCLGIKLIEVFDTDDHIEKIFEIINAIKENINENKKDS